MAKITFLGAAGTVTGSKYLIEAEGKRLLVDCGLFEGSKELKQRNWNNLPIDPATIDWVLLTHAHIDHTGYLPRLVHAGFQRPDLLPTRRRTNFASCCSPIQRTCRKKTRSTPRRKATAATNRLCRFTPSPKRKMPSIAFRKFRAPILFTISPQFSVQTA